VLRKKKDALIVLAIFYLEILPPHLPQSIVRGKVQDIESIPAIQTLLFILFLFFSQKIPIGMSHCNILRVFVFHLPQRTVIKILCITLENPARK